MNEAIPDRWNAYQCSEYFTGHWWRDGHYDEPSYLWVIAPLNEAYENTEFEFFAIGRSGAGGIDFGYRKGWPGLWAFYPIECTFKMMASNVQELVDGYCSGKLGV